MVQPDRHADSVVRVPPPWRLRGSGYVFLFTFEPWFLRSGDFLVSQLGEGFEGQLGAVVLTEHLQSPVGPYHELLFLAGRNLRWRKHRFSITRAYVSSAASAVNGRENWGIPKQTAEFEVLQEKDGTERVIVLCDGLAQVDLTVAPEKGLSTPVLGLFAPPSWRTIVQFGEGMILETRINGFGMLRPAKLLDFRTMPTAFPDVKKGAFVMGFRINALRLSLPSPTLRSRERGKEG